MNVVYRPGLKDIARSFISDEESIEKFGMWAFG